MLTNKLCHESKAPSSWQVCLQILQEKLGDATFETWFRTTEMSRRDGEIRVHVPNRFFADFIEQHFSDIVRQTLSEASISFNTLTFTPVERDWKVVEPISATLSEAQSRRVPRAVERRGQFHPGYTFESFVVGGNNCMARAASIAVAEAPGRTTFNPLIIYGGTGLGKTHLLQATGRFAQTEGTAEHVIYLTSEEFTNQYIDFVVNKKDSTSFYRKFLDVDMLLIDDIHFFGGKHGTQKEFFRIFNKLLLENKQIVLSSDRPPEKIRDMMHHIINRFIGGLTADIQPPNLETRMAILRQKAEIDGIQLPSEVVEFVANHVTSNVRELEGALIKLIASASFTGRDITLPVAREICGDLVSRRNRHPSVRYIQEKVARAFDVGVNQLSAHTRRRAVALPRNVAMYLCKKWTRQSLRTIGLDFGGRDYSTVVHACKRIEQQRGADRELRAKIGEIEALIAPAE